MTVVIKSMTKIIEEIEIVTYGGLNSCNCKNCRCKRRDECEGRLLLQIAPSLSSIPLKIDRQNSYNNYTTDLKYVYGHDRLKEVLRVLKRTEVKNKTFKKEHMGSTIKTCINCGVFHTPNYKHTIIHEDKKCFLCLVCVKDYQRCKHCDTLKRAEPGFISIHKMRKDDLSPRTIGVKVCHECYNNHYKRCHICDYVQINSQFEVFSRFGDSANDATICFTCCKKAKVICYVCKKDTFTFLSSYRSHLFPDRYYCAECSEIRIPIHDHTYKPSVQYFHSGSNEGKVSNSALYFGFELEIERYSSIIGRTAMAEIIKDKFDTGRVYIVHDGSIDEGIEIVSHPFTWEAYKKDVNKWTNLLLFIRTKEWKANRPKVGFHVHMTKAAFTTFHLFKFLKFFYREHNRGFICVVAQRNPTFHARFTAADKNNVITNAKDKANRSDDHYNAVNLNNKDTVEVRVFRGTLEPLYFHKNIEFLHALFKYSRDYSPKQMKYLSFINYIQQHHKLYPCLWEFLTNDVGIMSEMITKERKV